MLFGLRQKLCGLPLRLSVCRGHVIRDRRKAVADPGSQMAGDPLVGQEDLDGGFGQIDLGHTSNVAVGHTVTMLVSHDMVVEIDTRLAPGALPERMRG